MICCKGVEPFVGGRRSPTDSVLANGFAFPSRQRGGMIEVVRRPGLKRGLERQGKVV